MKSGKWHLTDKMEIPNQGILEADTIKQVEMKEKLRKSISREPES